MTSADTKPTLIEAHTYEPGDYPPELGRGLPVGWGWRADDDHGESLYLYAPGKSGADYHAAAYTCGSWTVYPRQSDAAVAQYHDTPIGTPKSPEALAAAQREAEDVLRRAGVFGDGRAPVAEPAPLSPGWQAMADATGKPVGLEGGAYSSDCYADWSGCVRLLFERGATLDGAETVLRSKHMRWCSDSFAGEYGATTVEHFARYLDKSADARTMAEIAEPAPREPSAPTDADEKPHTMIAADGTAFAQSSSTLTLGGRRRTDIPTDDPAWTPEYMRGDEEQPAPTDDPGDEPPCQPAPDRAAWLMLPVSLVGNETISGPRYNELASVARGLRARVAELEVWLTTAVQRRENAEEALARVTATPPPGTVAVLLLKVEEARDTARDKRGDHDGESPMAYRYEGMRDAFDIAAGMVRATLGAPTPLDRAREVLALRAIALAASADVLREERDTVKRLEALACDASATKEPR